MEITAEDFVKDMENTIFRNGDVIKFFADGDVLLSEYKIVGCDD